jgi:small-conductance mechanosensitive channel
VTQASSNLSRLGLDGGAGRQLLYTAILIGVVYAFRALVTASLRRTRPVDAAEHRAERRRFWIRQSSKLIAFALLCVGLVLVWFPDPSRLGTVAGLLTAGIAVALQRVITAMAAYLIILRGRVFTVGDRITIGGVRGDVVALGLIQTSVMEMGEPPNEDSGEPDVWVNARQYTGRVVNVTNDKIFDTPVYNYTREFPYLWEEMHFPIGYDADRARAESILLEIGQRHTAAFVESARPAFDRLRERYFVADRMELPARVYLRMTDNWLELTLRFIAPVRGVRALKDAMTREILPAFEDAGLSIASTTFEITGLPTVRIARVARDGVS